MAGIYSTLSGEKSHCYRKHINDLRGLVSKKYYLCNSSISTVYNTVGVNRQVAITKFNYP